MKILSKIDIYVIKKRIAHLNDDLYHYEHAIENIRYLESALRKDLELIENNIKKEEEK